MSVNLHWSWSSNLDVLLHISAWMVDKVAVHRAEKYLRMTELLKELNTVLTLIFAETCSFPHIYCLVKWFWLDSAS